MFLVHGDVLFLH